MPTARRAQRVHDEAAKNLNLLFFVYFIWKWEETFGKLHFFNFGPKQCFYLTHSAREYFEKMAFEKKTKNSTLSDCISKTRANSEAKVTFSESSLDFRTMGRFFSRSIHVGTRQEARPPATPVLLLAASRVERVSNEPVKDLNLLFFVYFIWKSGESFQELPFLSFLRKWCYYLTHSARE